MFQQKKVYVRIIKIWTFNIYRIDITKNKAGDLETNYFLLFEPFPGDTHGHSALHQIVRLTC